AMIRRPVSLKAIDADFRGRVQVPSRITPQRFDVAVIALGFPAEQRIASVRCRLDETPCGRLWRRDRELIKLQRRKLAGYQIVIWRNVLAVNLQISPNPLAAAIGNCAALFNRGSQN